MTQAADPERQQARHSHAPRPGHPACGRELTPLALCGQEPGPAGWEADGALIVVPPASAASFLLSARTCPDPAGPRYIMELASQAAPLARLQVTIGAARTGAREYTVTAQRAHLLYDTPQQRNETARAVMTSVFGPPGDRDEILDAAADLALVLHAAGFPWPAWDGTETGFPPGAALLHPVQGEDRTDSIAPAARGART